MLYDSTARYSKSPSARGFVACLPVRLLLKSTKNAFYPVKLIEFKCRIAAMTMWILKNSKELLEHLKSPTFNRVTSIKSFDFSTLYTTIPHQKLKDRLTSIIRNAFIFKNGNRRYKYLVLGHEETYFVKEHSDSKSKYSEDDIIKMLEFLVDNIFVVFAGKVFQQTVGIPMGTNCAPLLATSFCIHTKRISYNLCSLRERNI